MENIWTICFKFRLYCWRSSLKKVTYLIIWISFTFFMSKDTVKFCLLLLVKNMIFLAAIQDRSLNIFFAENPYSNKLKFIWFISCFAKCSKKTFIFVWKIINCQHTNYLFGINHARLGQVLSQSKCFSLKNFELRLVPSANTWKMKMFLVAKKWISKSFFRRMTDWPADKVYNILDTHWYKA